MSPKRGPREVIAAEMWGLMQEHGYEIDRRVDYDPASHPLYLAFADYVLARDANDPAEDRIQALRERLLQARLMLHSGTCSQCAAEAAAIETFLDAEGK